MENIPATEYHQINNLWNAVNAADNNSWAIKEYKSPRVDIDCVKRKKEREQIEFFEEVFKGQQKYPNPKEKYDSKGNSIIPERGNYFDILVKKKDYGYSDTDNEKIKKRHSNHNRSFNEENSIVDVVEVNRDKKKAFFYKEDRETIFDDIITEAEKSEKLYPHKENIIKILKEEIKKEKSAIIKNLSEILKDKYKNKGSIA
jgi:hypothetical protein